MIPNPISETTFQSILLGELWNFGRKKPKAINRVYTRSILLHSTPRSTPLTKKDNFRKALPTKSGFRLKTKNICLYIYLHIIIYYTSLRPKDGLTFSTSYPKFWVFTAAEVVGRDRLP